MNRDLLKKIPLFASLNNQDLDNLAVHLQRKIFAPQETIFWMDDPGDSLFIIQSGLVHISYPHEKGQDVMLARLEPGAFFGELSLMDGGPHTATARAFTEAVLLTLHRSSFYLFLEKHPQLSRTMLEVLSARLRSSTIRMRGVINVNEQLEERNSLFQKMVEASARVLSSGAFLTLSTLAILLWITVQTYLYLQHHRGTLSFLDRPPTFFVLGFLFTLTSFLTTILILNSQRHEAKRDRIRGEIEYQVNLKSQVEVMKLQLKMDKAIKLLYQLSGTHPEEADEETSI